MPVLRFTDHLDPLFETLDRWDFVATALEAQGHAAALSAMDRAAFRKELDQLCSEHGIPRNAHATHPFRSAWRRLFASNSVESLRAACERAENDTLHAYEILCERSFPFSISNVLLRQHAELTRAAHHLHAGPISWRPKRHAVAISHFPGASM